MDARLVDQVVGSPVFSRLILLACIAAHFLHQKRKDTEGQSGAFLSLLGILLVRDFLSVYFASSELLYISDIFHFGFALFLLLAPLDGSRIFLIPALSINGIAAVLFIGIVRFDWPALVPSMAFGYLLVADAFLAGLLALVYKGDLSTPARQLVSRLWPLTVLVLLAYSVLAILLGYEDPLFLRLVIPLSYVWLLAATLLSQGLREAEMVHALGYYEEAIDSLYSLFVQTGSFSVAGLANGEAVKRLNEILVAETGAEGGLILMPEEDGLFSVRAYTGAFPPLVPVPETLPRNLQAMASFVSQTRIGPGEGILGEVGKTGKNVYCPRAEQDQRFTALGNSGSPGIASFMAVPLMVEDRILGVSALVKTCPGTFFREEDFDRLKLLANFGAFAINSFPVQTRAEAGAKSSDTRAEDCQDTLTRELGRCLRPDPLPRYPGLSAAGMTVNGSGQYGGYYDLIQARKGKVIGAVSETVLRDLSAALGLVRLRSIVQVLGRTDKDMAAMLNWTSRILQGSIDALSAPSLGLLALNTQTGEMEYALAGNSGLLIHRQQTGSLDYFSKASVPLARTRSANYERICLQVRRGDMAVLFAEGAGAESQEGQGGRRILSTVLLKQGHGEAREVLERVRDALVGVEGATGPRFGLTVLVLKVE